MVPAAQIAVSGRPLVTRFPGPVSGACFGFPDSPRARPLPDAQARTLGELVARRPQIVEMMTAERNRRKRLASRRMVKSVERVLAALQRELLKTVHSVGDVTARTRNADLPELGTLGRKRIAALVGGPPSTETAEPCAASVPSGADATILNAILRDQTPWRIARQQDNRPSS